MQVGDWRSGLVLHMPARRDSTVGPTSDDHRQVTGGVQVGVGHPCAVQDQHVIQQRPVPVRCGLELVQVVREQRRVKRLDLQEVGDLDRVLLMVRGGVVRLDHSELGKRAPLSSRPSMNVITRVRSVW